jgi:hypothetical protein
MPICVEVVDSSTYADWICSKLPIVDPSAN